MAERELRPARTWTPSATPNQTWNCWRVIVDGSQDGSTWMTRCWRRSAATTADDWLSSPADVDGFSLKKSVRMRSTWAFQSRRRSSILWCICSHAARCRSFSSCARSPFVVAMLPLSAARRASEEVCRCATAGVNSDRVTTDRSVPGDVVSSASTAEDSLSDDTDVGRIADAECVENPLEVPDAGNTTNESIWNNYRLVALFSCNTNCEFTRSVIDNLSVRVRMSGRQLSACQLSTTTLRTQPACLRCRIG